MKIPESHVEARRFFDDIAEDYKRRSEALVYNVSSLSFRRRQDIVSRLVAQTPAGGTVLDYGMGPAVFGPAAVGCGLRYIGIDISPRMVEIARKINLTGAELLVGDMESLEQFHRTADTVLLIGLIDYLEDPEDGLRKLSACVKDDGRLIMSFRNRHSVPTLVRTWSKCVWNGLHRAKSRPVAGTAFSAPVLENSFVPGRDLIPLLTHEGFNSFRIEYLDCSPVLFNFPLPGFLWELLRRVDGVLACSALSFLCASGVLVAGKGSAKPAGEGVECRSRS
jgi:SAM-dependent methyltransferase